MGSISPTFYERLFRTKVLRKAFFVLAVKVKLFIGARILAQIRFKNVGEIDSWRLLEVAEAREVDEEEEENGLHPL